MSTVTKPIALDETLQSTNTALSSLGKDTTLQAIATAIANVGLSNIGNMSSLATTDKTSLVSAINEVVGDVSDLDTDKADKVASATNGNLAGLNASGNLTDSGWDGAKTTTSASGNPISITGLKSNQLAVNPVITFEPIQAGSGDPSPSNVRAISGYDKIEVLSCGKNLLRNEKYDLGNGSVLIGTSIPSESDHNYTLKSGTYTFSITTTKSMTIYYGVNRGSGVAIQSLPFTFTVAEKSQYRFWAFGAGVTANDIVSFQLEENSSATTYEPYHKTTDLSENLPQTVYGGSLDVRTGVLTLDRAMIDMGSLSYLYAETFSSGAKVFTTSSITNIKTTANTHPFICECYKSVVVRGEDYSISRWNSIDTSSTICINDSRYSADATGASQLKSALNGIKLVYELATPITIQLTPYEISLLKDYAYVSTNGTSIALDYHNGEIATLGDVAQLGETVNELGGCLNDLVICVTKVFSNTGSVAAGAYKSMVENVADIIPNGYKGVVAIPAYTGDDNFAWVSCFYIPSNNNLSIGIRNVTTTADSGAPQVLLLCIRV